MMTDNNADPLQEMQPDTRVDAADTFGLQRKIQVPAFSQRTAHVPDIDASYHFDPDTTLSVLAGFSHNRRVMVQGFHGTGKSTHIEQIAARLNWPCIRINLDSHISRMDLVGRDAIVLRDGVQVTEFREGLLPWALQRPVALVFDEYDAGRPDVMFVIQRVLEAEGKLTLLDTNRVITPHPAFRLFATANTVGLGDPNGLYHGTQQINQGQMDRWNILTTLNYIDHDTEVEIALRKLPHWRTTDGRDTVSRMVATAALTRTGFINGDVSVLMSPRTVITWLENTEIFGDPAFAFRVTFLNKADALEQDIIAEYYQRCMGSLPVPEPGVAQLKPAGARHG
ncbi:AAA family ATPase [Aquisalimonas sp.]|uniref:AAA family ATPase n=1 Tax=unclassified Aquisalimonas TaxID=2644645 RepID=UPI0025BE2A59|nr:AAA family ATPase [Aquisalimonas sp.]